MTIDSAFLSNALVFTLWFLAFHLYLALGITLGYHRLLTHKSFETPRWVAYGIVSAGYLALMGAPIQWVGLHRQHHQKSDMPGDPHTPRDGFVHALYGWVFEDPVQTDEELHRQTQDLLKDPFYRFLGASHEFRHYQVCIAVAIVWRLAILAIFGWTAFAACMLATVSAFWGPQFVNSICHLPGHGYRLFDTRDDSRNVWWVGIWGLGEGWHNNHHAIPKSARHGMMWWEVDVTYYAVWILEKLGLAKNVVRPPAMIPIGTQVKAPAPLQDASADFTPTVRKQATSETEPELLAKR